MKNELTQKRCEQKRAYRKTHKTYSLNYTNKEAEELEDLAQRKQMSVPEYLKATAKKERHNTSYIVPKDSQLSELIISIRRIGNNINQMARFANERNNITIKDFEFLNHELRRLEEIITTALTNPPTLEMLIREYFETDSSAKDKLKELL